MKAEQVTPPKPVAVNRILVAVAITLLFVSTIAAGRGDSIIGFWRLKKHEGTQKMSGKVEMEFRDGGVYVFRYIDPENDIRNVQTFEGRFALQSPDFVSISLDGKTQERYRYRFAHGQLRMEHLDYAVTNTLARIEKFSLK